MSRKTENWKRALHRPKTIDEILNEQIETAMREHDRPNRNLFLSSISAGLEIGFSIFLMAAIYSLFGGEVSDSLLHILLALAYPLGFIFVIIGKSELFTEHTTLAVIPLLNGNVTFKRLLILWGIIYAGNLLGGYVFAYILSILPGRMEILHQESFEMLARKLTEHPWHIILGSGVLAGWLMGLLSWLITSARDTISRILLIGMITSVIGIGGLHHAIVGSIEVFVAVLTSQSITLDDYVTVQVWATLGNIVGGVFFVALIKFSHAVQRE